METDKTLFADLPMALVEEIHEGTFGANMLETFKDFKKPKSSGELLDKGLVIHESDLGYPPPTTRGADGSCN